MDKEEWTIIDLHGQPKQVTDLKAAIEQADLFRGYAHEDVAYARLNNELKDYWQDMYQKLLQLKIEL